MLEWLNPAASGVNNSEHPFSINTPLKYLALESSQNCETSCQSHMRGQNIELEHKVLGLKLKLICVAHWWLQCTWWSWSQQTPSAAC